jgi:hypothetical protein
MVKEVRHPAAIDPSPPNVQPQATMGPERPALIEEFDNFRGMPLQQQVSRELHRRPEGTQLRRFSEAQRVAVTNRLDECFTDLPLNWHRKVGARPPAVASQRPQLASM